jgi:hypothetical protein
VKPSLIKAIEVIGLDVEVCGEEQNVRELVVFLLEEIDQFDLTLKRD